MSKGIKMSDCKFYVDESSRTVICVIPNTRHMVVDFIEEHFRYKDINPYNTIDFWNSKWYKELEMPASFMGKAKCAEEDEWNEDAGRLIAFSRAKDKCYKSFFKRANKFVQTFDRRLGDMIETFNDFGLKLEGKRELIETKIDELVSREE